MTYDQVIELVRKRGSNLVKGVNWQSGDVFDAVNSACIEYMDKAKADEATASLAITTGTRDYTVSTAIGTDVDRINLVVIDTGTIEGIELRKMQDEIHADADDEDDISNGTPEFFRVWNGVLRLYPTPDEDMTATVYYTTKIAQAFYTSAIGATTFPFDDVYVTPIIYEALAVIAEGVGNMDMAVYFRETGNTKLNDVMANRADYSADSQVRYQDPIGN